MDVIDPRERQPDEIDQFTGLSPDATAILRAIVGIRASPKDHSVVTMMIIGIVVGVVSSTITVSFFSGRMVEKIAAVDAHVSTVDQKLNDYIGKDTEENRKIGTSMAALQQMTSDIKESVAELKGIVREQQREERPKSPGSSR